MLEERPVGVVRRRDVIDDHVRIVLPDERLEVDGAFADLAREHADGDDSCRLECAPDEIDEVWRGVEDGGDGLIGRRGRGAGHRVIRPGEVGAQHAFTRAGSRAVVRAAASWYPRWKI